MAELGMDTDMMNPLPRQIMSVAENFQTEANRVFQQFQGVKWTGTDANTFTADFQNAIKTLTTNCTQQMNDYGTKLQQQIQEQVQASGGGSGTAA
jgi:hypothetical protein